MTSPLESYIDEYASSQHFVFLRAAIIEHAVPLLSTFCSRLGTAAPDSLTIDIFERVLTDHIAKLELPLSVKREVPALLSGFFEYLAESGAYPPAGAWGAWIATLNPAYQAKFRDNGSVKGETFTKRYSDVNRNDPCPCGSGKKFKKCCEGILS